MIFNKLLCNFSGFFCAMRGANTIKDGENI